MKLQFNAKSAFILVLVCGIIYGFIGPLSLVLVDYGMDGYAITFYRSAIAAGGMAVVILYVDRNLFKVKKEHILLFALVGITRALSTITYTNSLTEMSLSLTTVLENCAPFYLLLMSALVFKTKITKKNGFAVFLAIVAVCLVADVFSAKEYSLSGLLWGFGSGLTYAFYMLISAYLVIKGYNAMTVVFYAFLIAAIMVLPLGDVAGATNIIIGHPDALGSILMLGLFASLIVKLVNTMASRYVEVTVVNMAGKSELIIGTCFGFFYYHEAFNIWIFIGLVLMVVAIWLITNDFKEKKHAEMPPETPPSPS